MELRLESLWWRGGDFLFFDLQFKVFRVLPGETLSAVVAVALSPLSPAPVTHSLHRSNPIKPSNALYEFGGILKKKKKKSLCGFKKRLLRVPLSRPCVL